MTETFWKSIRWLQVLGLLVCGLIWGGCRSAEPVYRSVPASRVTDSTADTHILQVGQSLTVYFPQMQNAPEPHEERIKEDGTITLPLIGPLAVAGKTRGEVQELLQEKYAAVFRPLVLPPPRPRRFYYVGGQVKQPGPKAYLGETTVSTAIQAAGDFTDFANKKKVVLIRSDGRREIINVVDLLKAIDPPNDPPIYPGNRIEVPRKGWRF